MDFSLLDLFGGTSLGTGLFGAPGAGTLFGDMPVPGMPQMAMPQPGLSLLKAGDEDLRPQASAPPAGLLSRPGLEGVQGPGPMSLLGPTRSVTDVETTGSTAGPPRDPGINPEPIILPSPTGVTTPKANIVAPGPGGLRPVESRSPTPPGGTPPKIDTGLSSSSGTAPATQAPPPGLISQPPAEQQLTPLDKFNKALAGTNVGMPQQQPLHPANIGGVGPPHVPDTKALFQQLMEQHAKDLPQVGRIPGLPPGLQRRMLGGAL